MCGGLSSLMRASTQKQAGYCWKKDTKPLGILGAVAMRLQKRFYRWAFGAAVSMEIPLRLLIQVELARCSFSIFLFN
jgi:hypothetical protein